MGSGQYDTSSWVGSQAEGYITFGGPIPVLSILRELLHRHVPDFLSISSVVRGSLEHDIGREIAGMELFTRVNGTFYLTFGGRGKGFAKSPIGPIGMQLVNRPLGQLVTGACCNGESRMRLAINFLCSPVFDESGPCLTDPKVRSTCGICGQNARGRDIPAGRDVVLTTPNARWRPDELRPALYARTEKFQCCV